MWPFLLDRTVTINKRMRGTVSQVTEILYDVHEWCRLHPFVNKVEQDPDVPNRYKITDRLSGPWHLWEYDNSIHAVFTRQEDERGQGVNVSVTLPQTTVFPKLENQLRVKETETPGIVEVSEVVEMRVSYGLLANLYVTEDISLGTLPLASLYCQQADEFASTDLGPSGRED